MDIETRLELIKQVGEEIITEPELKSLLETKKHPIAYDGFEPSGTDIHIAQGLLRAININRMTKAGCKFKMLIADWHAWANNKMGGDLEKIQKVGEYYIEVWKACGTDLKNVDFVRASELLKDQDYWKTVMQVARHTTLKRVLRTVQIMGRSESDILQASQLLYPCMQAADIFILKADICQLGMDQRKVNMLAREIGPELGFWKPIVVSHHMLSSLLGPEKVESETKELYVDEEDELFGNYCIKLESIDDPSARRIKISSGFFNLAESLVARYGSNYKTDERVATVTIKKLDDPASEKTIPLIPEKNESTGFGFGLECASISGKESAKIIIRPAKLQLTAAVKMSKSKPETAIFMNDSESIIRKKIDDAYCPKGVVENNPLLEYCKYIIFPKLGKLKVERSDKYGGNVDFQSYQELELAFKNETLHPIDLKRATASALNELLEPIRSKLAKNEKVQNLLKEIKTFKVTR